jgi:hypothetical protein
MLFGEPIKPAKYAVTFKEVEEEKGNMSIQEKENAPAAHKTKKLPDESGSPIVK